MDGLNKEEVKELIEYIQENNSWEHLTDCLEKNRVIPKYYTLRIDTRTGDVWAIEFYQIIGYDPNEKVFIRTENGYNFKEKVYEWLNTPRK